MIKVIICFLLINILALPLSAGTLKKFESEQKEPQSSSKSKHTPTSNSYQNADETKDSEETLGEILMMELIAKPLYFSAKWILVGLDENYTYTNYSKHTSGEATLSYFSLEANPQWTYSTIASVDSKIELGYKLFCLEARSQYYHDFATPEKLRLDHMLFLIRWLRQPAIEMKIGVGAAQMKGEDYHKGWTMAYHLRLQPIDSRFAIQFKPAFFALNSTSSEQASFITEFDIKAMYVLKNYSFHVGYKTLSQGHSILRSPYIGTSFYY